MNHGARTAVGFRRRQARPFCRSNQYSRGCLLILLASSLGVLGANTNMPLRLETLDSRLPGLIKSKTEQAHALASHLRLDVSPEVWRGFDLFIAGDWLAASNCEAQLRQRNGQYGSVTNDPTVNNPVWQPFSEAYMALEQFATGEPKYAREFADGIIGSIPPGSVYFGGTDAGRGLVTALWGSQSHAQPFFTLTQNALISEDYLAYLRETYGTRLYIPGAAELQMCFSNYLADAQRRQGVGQLKPGESFRTVAGRVQLSGQVSVMLVNAGVAKLIFDRNPDREFYLEESFPLDWMYPRLVPHGLIMKLERQTITELSEALVLQDRKYWQQCCERWLGGWLDESTTVQTIAEFADTVYGRGEFSGFKGAPEFVRSEKARKNFSKLRSSIGGLFVWRYEHASSAAEQGRMRAAADLALRQAMALCPTNPEAVFRYVGLLLRENRVNDALVVAKTWLRLNLDNEQAVALVERLQAMKRTQGQVEQLKMSIPRLQDEAAASPTNFPKALTLADAYWSVQQTNRAVEVLERLLNEPQVDGATIAAVALRLQRFGRTAELEDAMKRLLEVAPHSPEAWYDMAAYLATMGRAREAATHLRKALDLSASRLAREPGARDLLSVYRKDRRFTALRDLPDFKQLEASP